jgi:hypothetical protein
MKAVGNSETVKASTKMFRAEFTSEPAAVNAGTAANLIFKVKDRAGHTIENLQIVHEKPMHLLVVSHDLASFTIFTRSGSLTARMRSRILSRTAASINFTPISLRRTRSRSSSRLS